MSFLKYVSLSFLLLLSFGCSNNSEKAIDFGKFENGFYTNTFFNLSVQIPDSWYVMDDESRIALMKKGKQIVAGNDKNLNAAFNAADLQNLNLLTTNESPPGSAVYTNPSFIILAESIKHAPGIVKGSDYHFHTRKIMESSQLNAVFPRAIYEETISGIAFEVLDLEINMGGIKNFQKQYATIMNKYALVIAITYQNDDGLKKLEQILQTIKLK